MTGTIFRVWLLVFLLFCSGIVSNSGCSCRTDEQAAAEKKKQEEEEKKKKKKKGKAEKPKPPIEFKDVRTTPSDQVSGVARNAVKPGHWTATTTTAVANEANINGELHAAVVDDKDVPIDIDHTNFFLKSNRPAALPKGQLRPFDSLVYVPRRFIPQNSFDVDPASQKRTNLEWRLTGTGGGSELTNPKKEPVTVMDDFQFFLIVLSANPSSYSYLLSLDSVAPPYSSSGLLPYFRIVAPRPGKAIPLPEAALAWTSISVLLWDDVDPASLSVAQQQALLDWLHWGGQLIVSGPRTLDRLRGSFLAPYLPVAAGDSVALGNEQFSPLNDHWSLTPNDSGKMGKGMWKLSVLPDKPLLGVELKLNSQGQFVPHCGELVAEGWVGRGRIAVTAFPLNDARLISWRNLDHFINGAILRRPARSYSSTMFQDLQLTWKDFPAFHREPRLISTVRYFSRDAGGSVETQKEVQSLANTPRNPNLPPKKLLTITDDIPGDDWHSGGYWAAKESGVGGWNDFSASADAARRTLQDAAKIKIPKADFVLKMVGVYLLILVPLNWLVFRAMGRVEWAWFAAPFIAIGAAGAVIRMAQLDIGFVRSRTDIAIIEMQGNYDRAHVTRYTALYTSLATDYDLTFDDSHALCLPLAEERGYQRNPIRDSAAQVTFRRDEKAMMRGFQVQSSSTAWTHSEQMLPVGGLAWSGDEATGWKLKNNTPWNLKEIGIIRKSHSGQLEAAWFAELQPEAKVTVRFATHDSERGIAEWKDSVVMAATERELRSEGNDDEKTAGEVRLWRLVQLATEQLKLAKGEVRLLAWTDQPLPGLTIYPNSAQFTSRSLILAHLQRGPLPPPGRDANTRLDVVQDEPTEDTRPIRDLGKDDEPPVPKQPQLPDEPPPENPSTPDTP